MTSGSTVAVTGAAGFIGRWVCVELLERGHSVIGIDNFSTGNRNKVAAFTHDEQFTLREGDVRDSQTVDDMLAGTDACIHLAAEIDVHESLNRPMDHFETNVVGTQHVLSGCRRHDVRLSLVGTCMVYDTAGSGDEIDEDHPVKPASPYAGSKLAAENLAESYYHGYDLPVTLLRPFNTYGPYQMAGVVPIFVDRDMHNKPLKIYGDGTQTRDLLYVTDCAQFIVEATFSDAAIGEVINAGTGVDISVNELAELVASSDTKVQHVEHHHPQSEISELCCDMTKAERLLDWRPEVSLEEGVDRIRTWLCEEEAD